MQATVALCEHELTAPVKVSFILSMCSFNFVFLKEEEKHPVFAVPQYVFQEFFRFLIGKPIHDGLVRTQTHKLPICVSVRVPPTIHAIAVGTLEPYTYETEAAITTDLGIELTKKFRLGSYAVIKPPLSVSYNKKKGKTQLYINYEVYSHANVLLWPVHYDTCNN
jgi:hypothetical protein